MCTSWDHLRQKRKCVQLIVITGTTKSNTQLINSLHSNDDEDDDDDDDDDEKATATTATFTYSNKR